MTHYILDARTATPHFPGIGRYVSNLARAMIPLLAADERLTILHDPAHPLARLPDGPVARMPVTASPFSLSQQWQVPRLARRLGAGLYHSPYIAMPYLPGVPALLTLYDLIPLRYPEHSTARARLLVRWTTRLALGAARHTIAISNFTRQDFVQEFHLPAGRITAIPLAADPAFCPQSPEAIAAVRTRHGLPVQFALYLGSNKPHKNLVRLVEAWQIANGRWRMAESGRQTTVHHLVIAGTWDARCPEARRRADELGLGKEIIFLGPVPEAELPALYAAATVFIFPSLYEGFGLPVLEAMACGTPVVCANTSSLPEVAGDAAVTADPLDVAALAAALARVADDASLRSDLREKGLSRAGRFNWKDTARRTLDLYRVFAAGSAG